MTLLCVGNYDRGTGYAWATIRQVWGRVAERLAGQGVHTLVVFREAPDGEGLVPEGPLLRVAAGWRDPADLERIVREHGVGACWLTDRPLLSGEYGRLRRAGVRFLVVHERTSGARTVPTGPKRWVKSALARTDRYAADRYVAISEYVRRRLLDTGCLPAARVTRIYNGIDTARWAEPVDRAAVRRGLGLDDDRPLIVMASRAQEYKGIGTLQDAVARIPSERPPLAIHCGGGPDLDLFRRRAGELGLADRFRMLGRRDDYRDLVRAADVAVVPPSWQEAFGLTVVEAMAAARPLVATRVGAIPELVRDGESGVLIEPGAADELAAALLALLDDPARAASLGAAAQADARARFDLARVVDELAEEFERGLGLR